MAEIAEERKLSINTIESHLSYFVSSGEIEIDDVVDALKQKAIQKAIEMFGASNGLKVLKENLPEEITYGEIKMVLATMHQQDN
jgi:ATP-dependent DNA helicase RecQ